MATVSVFGLGYVGSVVTACLAESGHRIIGVDTDRRKTDLVGNGNSPIKERGLEELLHRGVLRGLVHTTTDSNSAVLHSDVSLVCVGTPSNENGSPNLNHVTQV